MAENFKDKCILKYNENAKPFVDSLSVKAPNSKTCILQTSDVLAIILTYIILFTYFKYFYINFFYF